LVRKASTLVQKRAMNKVEEYRARARECETKAAQVQDPEVRQQLQDMARQWEQMHVGRGSVMRLLFSPLSAAAFAPPTDEQCECKHDK
jgi:hypothetical protein